MEFYRISAHKQSLSDGNSGQAKSPRFSFALAAMSTISILAYNIDLLLKAIYRMRYDLFGAGPSKLPSASDTSSNTGSGPTRYETVLQDEEKYQAKQYQTYEEVPGCMQLFDEFMMCYTLVPQLRSLYRYGEFPDCQWKWQDFKYCLSMKSEPTEKRRELWIKRRAEWWANRRMTGSSEDVWDLRSEPPANFPPLFPDAEDAPTDSPL